MCRRKVKRIISSICVVSLCFVLMISASAYISYSPTVLSPWYGVCTASSVNIRREANTGSEVVGSLARNDIIHIVGITRDYDWYEVQYNVEGDTGFVSSAYLNTGSNHNFGKVTATSAFIRESYSTTSPWVASVSYNTSLPYYGCAETASGEMWYAVVYSIVNGYIRSDIFEII